MRITIIFLMLITAFTLSCQKENHLEFNRPESVIWNPVTQSYLISNAGSGYILSMKDKVEFSVFNRAKLKSPKGMAILGNTLYVADVTRVVGFDLHSGKKTYELEIPDAIFLNDVAASDSNSIYISDTHKSVIIRVVPSTNLTEYFRSDELQNPNGIYYLREGATELLYINSLRSDAPVQVLNLFTRKFITLPNTVVPMADGITRDAAGSWLVSSWADSTVYKFSPDFSVRSQLKEHYRSPADIFYSIENQELAIPLMQLNNVDFIIIDDSEQEDKK